MITLVIVDCQNDFITGTMSVKSARNSVEEIKKFIKKHSKEIEKIIFTIEWHPYDHTSFKKFGGKYPSHCVQYTPGACIEPKLLKYVQSLNIDYEVSDRNLGQKEEQSGAFEDIELGVDYLGRCYYFDSVAVGDADSDFVLCGVNTQECVKNTIENMLNEKIDVKVFMPGIVSSDGGNSFSKFVKEKGLEKVS